MKLQKVPEVIAEQMRLVNVDHYLIKITPMLKKTIDLSFIFCSFQYVGLRL